MDWMDGGEIYLIAIGYDSWFQGFMVKYDHDESVGSKQAGAV
jgi:hypothetical protein